MSLTGKTRDNSKTREAKLDFILEKYFGPSKTSWGSKGKPIFVIYVFFCFRKYRVSLDKNNVTL